MEAVSQQSQIGRPYSVLIFCIILLGLLSAQSLEGLDNISSIPATEYGNVANEVLSVAHKKI